MRGGDWKLDIQRMKKREEALIFVEHIEAHLKELGIDGKVMCKICDKTIDEIISEKVTE